MTEERRRSFFHQHIIKQTMRQQHYRLNNCSNLSLSFITLSFD
jgi:hypothetical protein